MAAAPTGPLAGSGVVDIATRAANTLVATSKARVNVVPLPAFIETRYHAGS